MPPSVAITDGSSRDEGGGGVKALAKSEARPGIWLVDVPEPEVGINDVLIRVLRTGICGTDLHIRAWDAWAQRTIPVPMVVGHEFAGEVVEVGLERQRLPRRATSSAAKGTSCAAAAATAWPGGATCARSPRASASIAPARSPSSSRCR